MATKISPQGYTYGIDPTSTNPFWGDAPTGDYVESVDFSTEATTTGTKYKTVVNNADGTENTQEIVVPTGGGGSGCSCNVRDVQTKVHTDGVKGISYLDIDTTYKDGSTADTSFAASAIDPDDTMTGLRISTTEGDDATTVDFTMIKGFRGRIEEDLPSITIPKSAGGEPDVYVQSAISTVTQNAETSQWENDITIVNKQGTVRKSTMYSSMIMPDDQVTGLLISQKDTDTATELYFTLQRGLDKKIEDDYPTITIPRGSSAGLQWTDTAWLTCNYWGTDGKVAAGDMIKMNVTVSITGASYSGVINGVVKALSSASVTIETVPSVYILANNVDITDQHIIIQSGTNINFTASGSSWTGSYGLREFGISSTSIFSGGYFGVYAEHISIYSDGSGGDVPDITATATVDSTTGTPSVVVTQAGDHGENVNFAFSGLRGEQGETGPQGETGATPSITATASVDDTTGTPAVTVTKSGTDTAPSFDFAFTGLKGSGGGSSSASMKSITFNITSDASGSLKKGDYAYLRIDFNQGQSIVYGQGMIQYADHTSIFPTVAFAGMLAYIRHNGHYYTAIIPAASFSASGSCTVYYMDDGTSTLADSYDGSPSIGLISEAELSIISVPLTIDSMPEITSNRSLMLTITVTDANSDSVIITLPTAVVYQSSMNQVQLNVVTMESTYSINGSKLSGLLSFRGKYTSSGTATLTAKYLPYSDNSFVPSAITVTGE